jgi:cell division protein FtsL
MSELPIAGLTNRFLRPQRDRRWPHVLSAVLVVSAAVLVVLLLVGWPRLRSTSVHYELIKLRADVEQLERQERRLRLALEKVRSPARLGDRARTLGLKPPAANELRSPRNPERSR